MNAVEAQKTAKGTRVGMRMAPETKEYLEESALIGGYGSLTEFMVSSAREKAEEVRQKHEAIVATEKDKEVFFAALLDEEPNDALLEAAEQYKALLTK